MAQKKRFRTGWATRMRAGMDELKKRRKEEADKKTEPRAAKRTGKTRKQKSAQASAKPIPGPPLPPTISRVTVGAGISRRSMLSVDLTHPEVTAEDLERVIPSGNYTFEGRVAGAEKWAQETIKAQGPPTDGAEERVSPRWYADEILYELRLVRLLIDRGEAAQAAHRALELGMLVQEWHDVILHNPKILKWERWEGSGGIGGSRAKKIRPIVLWLRDLIKRYPDGSQIAYWNTLPSSDEHEDPIQVAGARLIRKGDRLWVIYDKGCRRSIGDRAFERYVGDAKKRLLKKSPHK